MTDFKQEWTLETAMEILQHPTVDSKIWAEAVEWLILYGPPDVREMLKTASSYAMNKEFPELEPQGFDENGDPVYSVSEIAEALNITEEEAAEIIAQKQEKHKVQQFYSENETKKVQ